MKTKTCCSRLNWLVGDAGKHGLAIVAADLNGNLHFRVQARSRDKLDPKGNPDVAENNFLASLGIGYCPFCGSNLTEWAASHLNSMRELVKEHSSLNEDLRHIEKL